MDDLQKHISTLEEDVKQKIEQLRQTQNPRLLTPQHSTPKEQPRNLTDSGCQGLYLAAALRVFSDLPTDKKINYETLVKSLEERFAPPNQNELYRVQLKERRQRASETLPELGQTIRRLVIRAYPLAPIEVKETLSKDYFLDVLHDSEMRIKIKQSRPQNLNQAICLA
ncbi:unnamed protein product [Mytilus coruscus]|uniref:Uncharacterized protein n=1 Tax=Mytilus coruscus TaxID=42192 RepID=A0A6J8B2T6_MYTCO|nr:unnamed protein product [Mytilus coruscus]